MSLTTLIHTKNSSPTLKRAIESIKTISQEIIIVDMHSSDDTLEIAKKYTKQVFSHPDVGYVEPARNFGLSKVTQPWVLILDADEELSPELEKLIAKVVAGTTDPELTADAYYLPRKNLIFDKWMEHTGWWPDPQMRLFKKGAVVWPTGIHQSPTVTGKTLSLPADEKQALIHHNYQTVHQYVDRMNRYTDIAAQEKAGSHPAAVTMHQLLSSFGDEFFRRFFAEAGLKDGLHGLSLSLLQANYEMVTQLKIWEHQGFPQRPESKSSITALLAFHQQLAYWIADWHVHHSQGLSNLWWRLRRKLKI